jgi:methyltransferase
VPRFGVPRWYAGLLAAVALQRVVELSISRSHEARLPALRAAPGSYPVMVAAHVGLLTLPLLEVVGDPGRRPRARWAVVLAGATALRVWSIVSLGRDWNVRAAVPASLKPVVRGPYAYIRHPNYLAVILEFAAIPLIAGARRSALVLSALNAMVLFDRIRDEERLLNASPAYRNAFGGRARFIPGLF